MGDCISSVVLCCTCCFCVVTYLAWFVVGGLKSTDLHAHAHKPELLSKQHSLTFHNAHAHMTKKQLAQKQTANSREIVPGIGMRGAGGVEAVRTKVSLWRRKAVLPVEAVFLYPQSGHIRFVDTLRPPQFSHTLGMMAVVVTVGK